MPLQQKSGSFGPWTGVIGGGLYPSPPRYGSISPLRGGQTKTVEWSRLTRSPRETVDIIRRSRHRRAYSSGPQAILALLKRATFQTPARFRGTKQNTAQAPLCRHPTTALGWRQCNTPASPTRRERAFGVVACGLPNMPVGADDHCEVPMSRKPEARDSTTNLAYLRCLIPRGGDNKHAGERRHITSLTLLY